MDIAIVLVFVGLFCFVCFIGWFIIQHHNKPSLSETYLLENLQKQLAGMDKLVKIAEIIENDKNLTLEDKKKCRINLAKMFDEILF